jgi:hypothetical protein
MCKHSQIVLSLCAAHTFLGSLCDDTSTLSHRTIQRYYGNVEYPYRTLDVQCIHIFGDLEKNRRGGVALGMPGALIDLLSE